VRPARGAAVPVLAVGGLLAGCASDSTAITAAPLCSDRSGNADNGVILMAQSVPTATWVPCISNALPLGWNFHHLDARNGVSRFWLDSDRDGQMAVEVRLEKSCDTAGATEVPSDRQGMTRLERVDRISPAYAGERYYLFDGGCMTVVFSLDGDNAGEALGVSSQVVGAIARSDLAAQVQEESGGRLSLDPDPGEGG
jgi:hypothetical protein